MMVSYRQADYEDFLRKDKAVKVIVFEHGGQVDWNIDHSVDNRDISVKNRSLLGELGHLTGADSSNLPDRVVTAVKAFESRGASVDYQGYYGSNKPYDRYEGAIILYELEIIE